MKRIALLQCASPGGDVAAGLAALDRALAGAAAAGAEMLVAPELFLPGYAVEPMRAEPDWPARLSAAAARAGTGLAIGFAAAEGGRLLNVAMAFGPDGAALARYAKRRLYGPREKRLFAPGEAPCAFAFAGRRIALMICYDAEFPEEMRAAARDGADLVLVPTANPEPFDPVCRFVIPAQAAMHGLTVAYANFCGAEGALRYCGRSVIAGPDGEPLAAAGLHPALLVADLPAPGDPALRPLSTQLADLGEA